jgi:glutamate 5-kinase
MLQAVQLTVVKVGSNVLTKNDGAPDKDRMASLVKQISFLKERGVKVVLVTSGAVAFGRKAVSFEDKGDSVVKKQILASVGQIELIRSYKSLFLDEGHQIAQLMVTKEDFRDRKHYLNMKSCLLGLLKYNIIPVINENDAVAVTELMFTDNDELAGLVAAMIDADSLILLTNVDGIYKGHPDDPDAQIIEKVGKKMPEVSKFVSKSKSAFGRGGMLTKMSMAKKAADLGIHVYIANGKKDGVLNDFYDKKIKATYFEPEKFKHNQKKWIAHSDHYSKGEVVINEGARRALFSEKITSLLPVGIISVNGDFIKGEVIRIIDEKGERIGLGKAEYSAKIANEKLGINNQKPLIHYDYLYLFQNL